MLRYPLLLLGLAVAIYAFADCLNTPARRVRRLPKAVWLVAIVLFGQVLVGPIAWFMAGRPRSRPAEPDGPAAAGGGSADWVPPDDNPVFLRSLDDQLRGMEREGF